MGATKAVRLLLTFIYLSVASAATASTDDSSTLLSLKYSWNNTPPNWESPDPCGDEWDGIECVNSSVTSIKLASMGLIGELSGDIGSLSELVTLDLSYNRDLTGSLPEAIGNLKKLSTLILLGCGFTGMIPNTIGSLQQLDFLALNSNGFTGKIPPSIGNLSKLVLLDIADNQLSGPLPVSDGDVPGLDMLYHAKHFHFGNNNFSGTIPLQLFSSEMSLIHVLFEGNSLTGSIPATVGLVQTLEVLRLQNNFLSGSVPASLSNLTRVKDMCLSNNKLEGPLPSIGAMIALNSLDMSNNSFDSSDFPSWISSLQSLLLLKMESTNIEGQIPVELFRLPNLQTVILKRNRLNGTLDIGNSFSNKLQYIDLQNNSITNYEQKDTDHELKILLMDNPICKQDEMQYNYCRGSHGIVTYSTQPKGCHPVPCIRGQTSSPSCKCAYPYTGTVVFRAPSFSGFASSGQITNFKYLEESLMHFFLSQKLPVDSVSLRNLTENHNQYLMLKLHIFPSDQDQFNRTGTSSIGSSLSNQIFQPDKQIFGPYYFLADEYTHFGSDPGYTKQKKSANVGIIIGVAAGAAFLVLLFLAGYAFIRMKRIEKETCRNSYFSEPWVPDENENTSPQLKGARQFSFAEIKKYTGNFSEANEIGSGGYGKVYRGRLPNGKLVAIKRARRESQQGNFEFKTEIELLSRVHHKNLVSLVGFCFERGELMLIYEHVPNGTLRDALSGKSGIRLDWMRRLKIALGAARGLAYLHELANPPIVHRDIKSTNILLDEYLNAKVADFGLSRSLAAEKDHISTQIKGTMGYLDPEYYMTQKLTEKSDVYSFGVLMLELITARKPIENGTYIVKMVRNAIDKTKDLYNLNAILDPAIASCSTLKGFEKFVDISLSCVEDACANRPTMNEFVREIENILHLVVFMPTEGSASTSESFEMSKHSSEPPHTSENSVH